MEIRSWTRRRLSRFGSDTHGAAAVEFGMVSPFIFFAVIAMVDLGQVVGERMDMGHVVRAGAESAMINSSEEEILDVLESTASKTFRLAGADDDDDTYQSGADSPISLSVNRYCECPESPATEVSCSNACSTDLPPNVLVDLTAAKTYSGMLLPSFSLTTAQRVQLR